MGVRTISAIAHLYVNNLSETIEFYCEYLGFEIEWHDVPDPEEDAANEQVLLSCAESSILFSAKGDCTPMLSGEIYFFVEDVEELYEELKHDLQILQPPTSRAGLRRLSLRDCNGFVLVFAKVEQIENQEHDESQKNSASGAEPNAEFELYSALAKYLLACQDKLDRPGQSSPHW